MSADLAGYSRTSAKLAEGSVSKAKVIPRRVKCQLFVGDVIRRLIIDRLQLFRDDDVRRFQFLVKRNHNFRRLARRLAVGRTFLRRSGSLRAADLRVRLNVLGEVVGAHELLDALGTLEALLAGVRAPMTLQLVRARELLAAEDPAADERPLARVPPQVSAQMRRFPVDLIAAGDMAHVLPLSRIVSVSVAVAAIRTSAGDPPPMLLVRVVVGDDRSARVAHLVMMRARLIGQRTVRRYRLHDLPLGRIGRVEVHRLSGYYWRTRRSCR